MKASTRVKRTQNATNKSAMKLFMHPNKDILDYIRKNKHYNPIMRRTVANHLRSRRRQWGF